MKKNNKLMTPMKTVRHYCYHCVGYSSWENVDNCDCVECAFHKYRFGKGRVVVSILRKFCLQCMCGQKVLVKTCTTEDCLIHPYRLGKNPSYSPDSIKNTLSTNT